MAEDEGQEEESEGGGGGMGKIILPVVALLIGAGGGWFLGNSTATQEAVETEEVDPQEQAEPKDPVELVGEMFKLDPFVVNLNESRGNRYLKTTIQLEMDNEALRPELERRQPQLQDIILALLTSKNSKELQALEGKFRLREELLSRINALLVNGTVKRVYFTEFVIQ
ncbi:MAG: flagellar basal body-associated FliL family protein [Magnetococcales bacterium]|nr:flagellar basal body-associated FliL family protein [Magnetococcales bacterium]